MWHFLIILAVIAFFYSSVGHGGASGYLALFAIYSLDTSMMKSSALLLNMFVSSISFWQYFLTIYFMKCQRNPVNPIILSNPDTDGGED